MTAHPSPSNLGTFVHTLLEALREIAKYDVLDTHGCIDEWSEAAAFAACQEIARKALETTGAGVEQ